MKNAIEEILGSVTKPTRYVGNEWNSIHKNDARLVRIALAFPDLYEIGMSHLGMNIIYHLLNEQEDVVAERVYAPWIDMEEKLRKNKIPLFSLETQTPLKEFDIIGFSLQYEMCYTNVLNILDLSDIPLIARDRDETHPLIIAGGACVFNPEPISEFIDIFVIGEAEEVIIEIVSKYKNCRAPMLHRGKKGPDSRQEMLKEMAKIEGAYIPSEHSDVSCRIKKRIVNNMDLAFCPTKPIVPFQSIVHDRAVVEVFRGCTQGCRFCQAGMISRPVRARSLACLRGLVTQLMRNTGWDEISLLGLNIYDYPDIEEIISDIMNKYGEKGVHISLPSLRPDNFSLRLAQLISTGTPARPTLTFAPEAGTQRLRDVINKNFNQDELMESIGNVYRAGWDSCKLYFMIGLPGETDEDIRGIIALVKELNRMGRKINPRANVRMSISPFVPKSHTPFQWESQEKVESLRDKQKRILGDLRRTEIRWSKPELSFLEGVFARGDRKLSKAILYAWKNGARFDAWEETFKFSLWEDAFQKSGIDPASYLYRKREYDEILPWDYIDAGVTKEFLVRENKKSKGALTTPNCSFEECQQCGACDKKQLQVTSYKSQVTTKTNQPSTFNLQPSTEVRQRVRMSFGKGERLKYISHLDLHRTLIRALSRAEIPIAFSRSYHPHPEVIPGLPLSVGMTSDCEFCDVFLNERMEPDEFARRLSAQLPEGFVLKGTQEILLSAPPLPNVIKGVKYEVKIQMPDARCQMSDKEQDVGPRCYIGTEKIEKFLAQREIIVHRKTPKSEKTLNVRHLIENIECRGRPPCRPECSGPDSRHLGLGGSASGTTSGQFTFEISLKITKESNARPDEVIRALLGQDVKIIEINRTEIKI